MKIQTLDGIPMDYLHKVSNEAYADYVEPVNLSCGQLQYLLERRGFRAELSLGAFDGDDMVGFVFNGAGEWGGFPTAYDTGTAVLPAWRRKGVSTRLFQALLPLLRGAGIEQYLLEVIRTNTGAVELYRKSGFEVSREFDYWNSDPSDLTLRSSELPEGYEVRAIATPDWDLWSSFWDFEPSWQYSQASVSRKIGNMAVLGAFRGSVLAAYGCMEFGSGDVPQLAVAPEHRRRGLATLLISALLTRVRPREFRVTNTSKESAETIAFLRSLGLKPGAGQYEMILKL